MRLTLDPLDLKPEHQKGEGNNIDQAISTSRIEFKHLNEAAQAAVLVVGKGTFFSWDEQTYNAIYPTK